MAHSTLILEHPRTGEIVRAPVGFSWTSLFWGWIVPFFRQDWLAGIATLILTMFVMVVVNIVMAFVYNRYFIQTKLNAGFLLSRADSEYSNAQLEQKLGLRLPVASQMLVE